MLKSIIKTIPPFRRLIKERDDLRDALRRLDADNPYANERTITKLVTQGRHREAVGGLWEEIGSLQCEFLISQGLRPAHRLLDLGCGSLRGGVKFIRYLDPGRYWGIDINEALLEAGWQRELSAENLQERQPREQLVCLQDFEFSVLETKFDFVVAISVFSHLNLNMIRLCLTRLSTVMQPSARVFATFFEVPKGRDRNEEILHTPGNITTFPHRNPFHYKVEDFEYAIVGLPLEVRYLGNWNHPRGQRMLEFRYVA